MFSSPNASLERSTALVLDDSLEHDALAKQCQFSSIGVTSCELMACLLATIQYTEPVDEEGCMPERPGKQVKVSQDVDSCSVLSKGSQAVC